MESNSTMPDRSRDGAAGGLLMDDELFSGDPYFYQAYGLNFSSEIRFPQWPAAPASGAADIEIRHGVIFGPDYVPPDSVRIEASPGRILLRGSKSATILISEGKTITVERLPGGNPGVIRQMLLGWALAGIFHQLGLLPLHGSTLCRGESCFTICAESGAGKSTMAVAFLNAGFLYLDDNVAVIDFQDDGPRVVPGIPEIRVWGDALRNIKFEHTIAGPVKPALNKIAVLARTNFKKVPSSLKKIFILRRTQNSSLVFENLTGAAKFQALVEHVFCLHSMGDTGNRLRLFHLLQTLAAGVTVEEIRLPAEPPRPEELCRIILDSHMNQ